MNASPGRARRAVIFDFDGVLADTEPLHCRAFQDVLDPEGIRFGWDEYLEAFVGWDDRDALRLAYRREGRTLPEGALPALIARKAAAFDALARGSGDILYDGAARLVHGCRAAGAMLAICSGALRADIEAVLDGTGLLVAFDHVVTAEDVEHSKPDPASYRLALAHLGVDPSEAIVLEDTPAGIESARGAGLDVIGVASTHPADRLGAATRVVESIRDLSTRDVLES